LTYHFVDVNKTILPDWHAVSDTDSATPFQCDLLCQPFLALLEHIEVGLADALAVTRLIGSVPS
jgi:hypothetical protein